MLVSLRLSANHGTIKTILRNDPIRSFQEREVTRGKNETRKILEKSCLFY